MRALFAGVCLGFVLACSGPTSGDGGTGGGGTGGSGGGGAGGTGGGASADAGPSLLDFCARYPAAICRVKVACGTYSDAGYDACVANEGHRLADYCGRADAGVEHYAPAAAQACLDETKLSPPGCLLAEFGCGINVAVDASPFSVDRQECGAATCAPGTSCTEDCSNPQCIPGRQVGESCEEAARPYAFCDVDAGYCRADDGGYGGPTAVCRPYAGLDMPCDYDTCGPGRVCANGTCQAMQPRDAPCDLLPCLDGVCRSTDHRCGALDAGAPCTVPADCGFGADTPNLCIGLTRAPDGGLADAGVCGPRPKHGEPCSIDWTPYSSAACPPGDGCLDGQCRTLTPFTAPVGSECPTRPWGLIGAPYYGFAYCQAGLACLRTSDAHFPQTGRCAPRLPVGAPCFDEFNCTTLDCGANPDGGASICVPRAGLHEPCGTCLGEFTCASNDAGTSWCVPPVATGDNCAVFAACAAGYCDYPDFVCKPWSTGACDGEYRCESGWCSGGQCVPVGACRAAY